MRNTGHELVEGFAPEDFRFWYDPAVDHPAPFLATTLHAGPAWRPILRSGNGDWKGDWGPAEAAMEREVGPGVLRVCQLSLAGRIAGNPVAEIFARRLLQAGSPVNE
jgi:hypothetical protein